MTGCFGRDADGLGSGEFWFLLLLLLLWEEGGAAGGGGGGCAAAANEGAEGGFGCVVKVVGRSERGCGR